MEDIGTEAMENALKFERQLNVAEAFAATLEDVDTAEDKLRYFMESNGAPLYDAATIRSDVLILRSAEDFWSRAVDVNTMREDLMNAASISVHELPGASHYVHLVPGEGREQFLSVVMDYLADGRLDGADGAYVPDL